MGYCGKIGNSFGEKYGLPQWLRVPDTLAVSRGRILKR